MKSFSDAQPILARLVRVKSPTGSEAAAVEEAAGIAREAGLSVEVFPEGLRIHVAGDLPGGHLAFATHLDTVPEGEGWSLDPYRAVVRDGLLYGRGAVDAKGCAAAMIGAAARIAERGLARGRLSVLLSLGEEGDRPSLPGLLRRVPPIDAAVVGEPTNMQIATSQRGLMVLELRAKGRQGHAARTDGRNAILELSRNLLRLETLKIGPEDPDLGAVRLTPTRLYAGVADNVCPPEARAVLDVRTTPSVGSEAVRARLEEELACEIAVLADLWPPCRTPENHPLVREARKALPQARTYASDAASDWCAFQEAGVFAIKLGPGDPALSHGPDEHIPLTALERGVEGYRGLALAMLALDPGGKEAKR